jgi:hypothetical protein
VLAGGGWVDFEIGKGDKERAFRAGGGFAGDGGRADEAVDAEGGIFELGVDAGDERGWDLATGDLVEVVRREGFEFDAEEVGGLITEVGDAVAFLHARRQAEGSDVRGRTGNGQGVGWFVVDADFAGVVEVDVERGVGGVVVHGDDFVGAVMDAHDEEVMVVEDSFVVFREGGLGEGGGGEEGEG